MKPKLLTSWSLIWLVVTVLFVAGGALNLLQRSTGELPPTDGVLWVEKADGLYAAKVLPGLAASRQGISVGDKLISVSLDGETFDEVTSANDVPMYLATAGVGGSLTYLYQKPSYTFADNYYYADISHIDTLPRWNASMVFLGFVGLVWLAVGAFVLFKQGSGSPFVIHFAIICLAAFVFHVYRSLNTGQDFDLAVSLIDDIAFAFFAPLFLHFCLRYPVRKEIFGPDRTRTLAFYLPAAILSASLLFITLGQFIPIEAVSASLRDLTSRFGIFSLINTLLVLHFVAGITAGAVVLISRFLRSRQTLVRQRLKWAMWGTIASVIPLVIFQLAGRFVYLPDDTLATALTTLPLALIPLSFGHSVVRYRLMDVDVVVRRALVYAMTTLAIAMMIGAVALGLVFLAVGDDLSRTELTLRGVIAVVAMAAIVMLTEPIKNYLQERADRYFYGTRYDLRQGLLDFGRTLSATTTMEPLLRSLTERIADVLDVEKVAILVEDDDSVGQFRVAKSLGLSSEFHVPADFRQTIRERSAVQGIMRVDDLDSNDPEADVQSNGKLPVRRELHYFVPCVVRSKLVAVIGLGRRRDGALLSSEDLEILRTISGYIGVAIDNSKLYQEQREHTEELALLKEFNESIVESVNVGLLAVDEDGRIIRCNSTFETMMGLMREEAIGRSVDEVFDPAFAANLNSILGRTRWHLTEIRNAYKLHITDAAGHSLIVNVAVAPLRSISTEQTGAILVLENVTSRVKLEENMQQSEKLSSIGLLAAGVAHEVNTPLTGVSSYTQMLLGMIPDTDPKHALLQKMQRQTDRASNIVGNLLNFSRTGNAIELAEVNINALLNDTLQLLEPQMRSSNITVVKDYSAEAPIVFGNASKLQQVFTNLVLNARDAMFEGGTITLTTVREPDDSVRIEVADTGEGIKPEDIGRIFDPFFTTKGVGNGTGLGLAVSYGIVQEHAGTIEASSDGESAGAVFRLSFPAAVKQRHRAVS